MAVKTPRKIVSDAIIKLLMEDPLWGCLLIRLNILMTRNLVPKLGTDGKYLIVNSDWVNVVDFATVTVGFVHEAVHLGFKHIFRRENRDFDRWNRAIDHVTNLTIRRKIDPVTKLPSGYDIPKEWLCDLRFDGMSAEKVYDILENEEAKPKNSPPPPHEPDEYESVQTQGQDPGDEDREDDQDQDQDQDEEQEGEEADEPGDEQQQRPGKGNGKGKGQPNGKPGQGGGEDGEEAEDEFDGKFDPEGQPRTRSDNGLDILFDHAAVGEEEAGAEEELLDIAIQSAYEAAKAAGKAPGYYASQMEARNRHVIDYKELLRDWLAKNVFCQDYNWMICDRRFMGSGFHIPALADGDGQAKILLIVDVSGSMLNNRDMGKCASEIQGVLEEFPGKYWVLYTDTVFQGAQEVTYEDPLKLDFKGGGGTDFQEIMEHVRQESETDFEAILFFTDMCTCSFGRDPEKPVLWMSTSEYSANPPFGKVIQIRT